MDSSKSPLALRAEGLLRDVLLRSLTSGALRARRRCHVGLRPPRSLRVRALHTSPTTAEASCALREEGFLRGSLPDNRPKIETTVLDSVAPRTVA